MLYSHDNFLLIIWQTNYIFPRVLIPFSFSLDKLVFAAIHKSLSLSPTQRTKAMPLCLWIFSLLCRYTSDPGHRTHTLSLSLSLSLSPMATVTSSFHFSTLTQSSQRNLTLSSNSPTFRLRVGFSCHYLGVRASSYASKMVVRCSSSSVTGLFGSPLSEAKRVQLYMSFELLFVLWELGCFQFLFFLRFGVENDLLIAGVWLSIFKSVF